LYETQEESSPDFTLSTENLTLNVAEVNSIKIFDPIRLLGMEKELYHYCFYQRNTLWKEII